MSLITATGAWVNGRVLDEAGTPLPFAWITPEQIGAARSVLPGSDTYLLSELPPKTFSLLINAPGYYSRAKRVDLSAGSLTGVDISLVPQPGTQNVPWGDGAVIVPAESQVEVTGREFVLENGWLWGRGDSAEPIVIRTPTAEISLFGSEFALEYLPGKRAWLYVLNGRAQVRQQGDDTNIMVDGGQMVNLFNDAGLQAVLLEPVVVSALHPDQSSPLSLIWEPTVGARLRDQLARIGISTAQLITFITYFIVLTSLFVVPLVSLYLRWKNKTIDNTASKSLS